MIQSRNDYQHYLKADEIALHRLILFISGRLKAILFVDRIADFQ